MSRAGVSMSLRTRGSGPPGAKMGAKLKAPLEELDWDRPELDPTCWRSLGDARTLEEQMGIIRQGLSENSLPPAHLAVCVEWFFELPAKSSVRKVLSSSFNRLWTKDPGATGPFSSYLSKLLSEKPSPSLSVAVVRCFETCSPAREAAEAAAPKLTDRLVDALADLREESEIGTTSRALLCLHGHSAGSDQSRAAVILAQTVEDGGLLLSPDSKLNLILCLTYKVMQRYSELEAFSLVSGGKEKAKSEPLSRVWALEGDGVLVLHSFLIALSDDTLFSSSASLNKVPVATLISRQLQEIGDKLFESSQILQYSRAMLQLATRVHLGAKSTLLAQRDLVSLLDDLEDFIWDNVESTIDSVRMNVKNALTKVLRVGDGSKSGELVQVQQKLLKDLLALSWRSRAKYSVLSVASKHPRFSSWLLKEEPKLPDRILENMKDPTLAGHCSELYKTCLREYKRNGTLQEEEWFSVWVRPPMDYQGLEDIRGILSEAMKVGDKILERIHEDFGASESRLTKEQLMCYLAVVKSKKQKTDEWKVYVTSKAFQSALYHYSDKVRIDSLETIVTSRSSAETYTLHELREITTAVENNMKLEATADRQNFLAIYKKMLLRFKEGFASKKIVPEAKNLYSDFLWNQEGLLASQLVEDACSDRRHTALECAATLLTTMESRASSGSFSGRDFILRLTALLDDPYTRVRDLALTVLLKLLRAMPSSEVVEQVTGEIFTWEGILEDCSALSPVVTTGVPYKAALFLSTEAARKMLCEESSLSSGQEVFARALEAMLEIVHETLDKVEEIDREAPAYGFLLCSRRIFSDFLRQGDRKVDRLQSWVKGVLRLMHRIRAMTAYILEGESPEGFSRTQEEEGTVEVQADLLCAWRSSKELSHLLADIFVLSQESGEDDRLLTEEEGQEIVFFFRQLMEDTVHRGAFEQAFAGFVRVCNAMWNSNEAKFQDTIKSLIADTIGETTNKEFCPTRRSAGIPFLVQALIASQPPTSKSMPHVTATMRALLDTANSAADVSLRVQASNILRGLYKNNNLGDNIGAFVEDGLRLAFQGFRSATWSERNAACLLFSALITRVFGVKRGRDEFSPKNLMPARFFFQRYPSMHEVLEQELAEGAAAIAGKSSPGVLLPRETALFPALVVLAKLRPSPTCTGKQKRKTSAFVPHLRIILASSSAKIRDLSARILAQHLTTSERSSLLPLTLENAFKCTNWMHGVLLLFKHLLSASEERYGSEVASIAQATFDGIKDLHGRSSHQRCSNIQAESLHVALHLHRLGALDGGSEEELKSIMRDWSLSFLNAPEVRTPLPSSYEHVKIAARSLLHLGLEDDLAAFLALESAGHRSASVEGLVGSDEEEEEEEGTGAQPSLPAGVLEKLRTLFCESSPTSQASLMRVFTRELLRGSWPVGDSGEDVLRAALEKLESSRVREEKSRAIVLCAALIQRGVELEDLTLRWMNCLHSSASSSSFGNEIVRKAAARALSMNARLLGGTKGPWVFPHCRLVLSFASDDDPAVRQAALKTAQALAPSGHPASFPSIRLPEETARTLLLGCSDKASAFLAVADAVVGPSVDAEPEDEDIGPQDVFEKSSPDSWREPSLVESQLKSVLLDWLGGSSCLEERVGRIPRYLRKTFEDLCLSPKLKNSSCDLSSAFTNLQVSK